MANVPKKVALIGLDCAMPHLILKHIADGHLPTFKKLFDGGVLADNCLVPYPTVTPPNWASIATGAWPGTHCITDFHVHNPGTTPVNYNIVQAFNSERCKAEYIWDALDRAGKKCIVFNYPTAWPSHMKNGIMVGGAGLSVGEHRDGNPAMGSQDSFCNDQLITNGFYPQAIRGSFEPAQGWKNLPKGEGDALELDARLNFRAAAVHPAETHWYALAGQSGDDTYDHVTLSPCRDFKDAFCTLKVGEWSPKIVAIIKMKDGSTQEVFFRCKLIELSEDTDSFRLYISSMGRTEAWCSPPRIAGELKSETGIIGHGGGVLGYALEWFDIDTFVEIGEFYTKWLEDGAAVLMTKHEWDLFFMHAHAPDWFYHVFLTDMDENLNKNKESRKAAWDAHLKIYEAQDRMIARLLECCDKDTLIILVSDHGATADGSSFDPYKILSEAGLLVLDTVQLNMSGLEIWATTSTSGSSETEADLKDVKATRVEGMMEELKTLSQFPDVNKSKCFPQRSLYVYINLKNRDPEGIVDPKDYAAVQQQIIDALLTYVDPKTGKRPVALALAKQDARILGLYGDAIGDVVYALYPWYSGQHGMLLPGSEWGVGSLKGLLSFTGPGIKKGYKLERTCSLVDIVPTICYLMDLQLPADVEGSVLYQLFKDPDFKIKEINKLKDGLSRMETALQRGERQPWDKHECA
jgi:predicted AlkP superfamily phosphohydrolase/phosphomutase